MTDDPPTNRRAGDAGGADGPVGGRPARRRGPADGDAGDGDGTGDGNGTSDGDEPDDEESTGSDDGEHATGTSSEECEDAVGERDRPVGERDRPVPDRVRVEDGRPPSEAVLRGVEAVAGVDLAESDERLGDVVDVDALDALFGPARADGEDPGRVEFAFCGCRVTVESDGRVDVVPADAS